MFCKNCGKEIEEDARFCPECGERQNKEEVITPNPDMEENASDFNFDQWIEENGLTTYKGLLQSQDFDREDVLVGLQDSDLLKMGIESTGTRKKILNAVQTIKQSTGTASTRRKESIGNTVTIPNRCPKCNEIWGREKENSGITNSLGKALIGGLLLGPVGAIGGAALGNKTITYRCNHCGFKKVYKNSLVTGMIHNIRETMR